MAPVRYAPRPSCAWFSPRLTQIVPMVGKEILIGWSTRRPPSENASPTVLPGRAIARSWRFPPPGSVCAMAGEPEQPGLDRHALRSRSPWCRPADCGRSGEQVFEVEIAARGVRMFGSARAGHCESALRPCVPEGGLAGEGRSACTARPVRSKKDLWMQLRASKILKIGTYCRAPDDARQPSNPFMGRLPIAGQPRAATATRSIAPHAAGRIDLQHCRGNKASGREPRNKEWRKRTTKRS
jgi:hypothetical protein